MQRISQVSRFMDNLRNCEPMLSQEWCWLHFPAPPVGLSLIYIVARKLQQMKLSDNGRGPVDYSLHNADNLRNLASPPYNLSNVNSYYGLDFESGKLETLSNQDGEVPASDSSPKLRIIVPVMITGRHFIVPSYATEVTALNCIKV